MMNNLEMLCPPQFNKGRGAVRRKEGIKVGRVDYEFLKAGPQGKFGGNFYCSKCTPPDNGLCKPSNPADTSSSTDIMGCGCYPPGYEDAENKSHFWCPGGSAKGV